MRKWRPIFWRALAFYRAQRWLICCKRLSQTPLYLLSAPRLEYARRSAPPRWSVQRPLPYYCTVCVGAPCQRGGAERLEHFSVDFAKEQARRQYAQYGEREATQGKSLKNVLVCQTRAKPKRYSPATSTAWRTSASYRRIHCGAIPINSRNCFCWRAGARWMRSRPPIFAAVSSARARKAYRRVLLPTAYPSGAAFTAGWRCSNR